jgi:nucleotide-binding universal stress UspA family protein
MSIKSILVLTDLSSFEEPALHRARVIAKNHRAALTLLHYPSSEAVDAADGSIGGASLFRKQLEEELGHEVNVTFPAPGKFGDVVEMQARAADLVVVPYRRTRSVTEFFKGQPVLRLLRASRRPLLVVRAGPIERYAKILVATDLHDSSGRLVESAAQVAPAAAIELFHAVSIRDEAKLRSAEAPEWAVKNFRERRMKYAEQRIQDLVNTFKPVGGSTFASIARGDPGHQIAVQQRRSDVDLIVVGKRHASSWRDFFFGSVVSRVLDWCATDVLVIPDDSMVSRLAGKGSWPDSSVPQVRPV